MPRLKWFVASKHITSEMRLHKDKCIQMDGVIQNLGDAQRWKYFDSEFPQFALGS